jgi:hypothetical protein
LDRSEGQKGRGKDISENYPFIVFSRLFRVYAAGYIAIDGSIARVGLSAQFKEHKRG